MTAKLLDLRFKDADRRTAAQVHIRGIHIHTVQGAVLHIHNVIHVEKPGDEPTTTRTNGAAVEREPLSPL